MADFAEDIAQKIRATRDAKEVGSGLFLGTRHGRGKLGFEVEA